MSVYPNIFVHFVYHSEGLIPNPFKGFTLQSEGFEGLKGVEGQTTASLSALHTGGAVIMQSICAKNHEGPKCPSVIPFEILHSEGPFEVASFEHFGLERLHYGGHDCFHSEVPFGYCDYILFGTHRQLFGLLHSSTLRSSHSRGYRA